MLVLRTLSAACLRSADPTGVDPVNVSLRRRRSAMTGADNAFASEDGTTLSTPSGRPARRNNSTRYRVVSGVRSAGFSTTVHPAASAGAIFRVAIASGKFHGVIAYTGPTGRLRTIPRPVPSGLVR